MTLIIYLIIFNGGSGVVSVPQPSLEQCQANQRVVNSIGNGFVHSACIYGAK